MARESSKIKFPFEHCGLATQSKGADNLLLFNEKFSSKFQLLKTFPLNRARQRTNCRAHFLVVSKVYQFVPRCRFSIEAFMRQVRRNFSTKFFDEISLAKCHYNRELRSVRMEENVGDLFASLSPAVLEA